MAWWLWMILGFALLLAELATPGGFYLLFFGLSGLVVGILTVLNIGGPSWLQWLLFTVFSVATVAFFRKPLVRRFSVSGPGSSGNILDTDGLVGESAVALESIVAGGLGRVEMRGSSWKARNRSAEALAAGQHCVVEHTEGLTLEVRPQ